MQLVYEDRGDRLCLWRKSDLAFLPHFHDSIEIVYMLQGECSAVIDEQMYRLRAGDLALVMPGRIHSYSDDVDAIAYVLIIPRRYCEAYASLLDTQTPANAVIHCDACETVLRPLIETTRRCNYSSHVYRKQMVTGYLSVLFGEIFSRYTMVASKRSSAEAEHRIVSYCLEHFTSDISLNTLSEQLNISRSHISYIFSAKLKMSLPAFLGSLRVTEAKRLIESGKSITDAALASGFSSIRTFNRHFLEETKMTPRAYRDAVLHQPKK